MPLLGIIGAHGKMGRTLLRIIEDRAHVSVVTEAFLADEERRNEFCSEFEGKYGEVSSSIEYAFEKCDVVIDYTHPACSLECAAMSEKHQKILISGTTGFSSAEFEHFKQKGAAGRIVWAPNTSLGVNILIAVTKKLAQVLDSSFDVEILERHHNQKKDAPSGTALALGSAVAEGRGQKTEDTLNLARSGKDCQRKMGEIGFQVARHGETIGLHEVSFWGKEERIWVGHESFDRALFAKGALVLARVAHAKTLAPGFYTFADIIDLP